MLWLGCHRSFEVCLFNSLQNIITDVGYFSAEKTQAKDRMWKSCLSLPVSLVALYFTWLYLPVLFFFFFYLLQKYRKDHALLYGTCSLMAYKIASLILSGFAWMLLVDFLLFSLCNLWFECEILCQMCMFEKQYLFTLKTKATVLNANAFSEVAPQSCVILGIKPQ